jgi:hypothetical protein
MNNERKEAAMKTASKNRKATVIARWLDPKIQEIIALFEDGKIVKEKEATVIDHLSEPLRSRVKIAIAQLRIIPKTVVADLVVTGIWDDLRQTCIAAAVEGVLAGDDDREMRQRAQRAIYRALCDYGYRRPRGCPGYLKMEVGDSVSRFATDL